MKKLISLVLVGLILVSLVSCGPSEAEIQEELDRRNNIMKNYNTSSQQGTGESSEVDNETIETVPEVTYDEIQTGEYNGQTVSIRCAVSDVDFYSNSITDSKYISFDCWIFNQDGYVFDPTWLIWQDDLEEAESFSKLEDTKEGDLYIFTVDVNDDSSFGSASISSFQKLEETVDIALLEQQYKDTCISYSCEELLRNPENYQGKNVNFNGEVFQIVVSDGDTIEFLLDTGEDNGIVYAQYIFSDGESRILEGDQVMIYGPFYSLETYTSIIGTQRTVPKLYAYFLENNN